jgi:UDP-GlcNAc:undecaprenyl-phosphate GlcNAc-1-phosphate transferase
MENTSTWIIIASAFFAVSISISIAINWLFLKLALNLGSRNPSSQIRWSPDEKPALGGISFFIVFLISIAFVGTLPRETGFLLDSKLIGLIAATTLGFLIGLGDDAYNTNPLVKFIGQLMCAFILILSDVYIHVTEVPALDFALTGFWVIGLMNSINMLDNIDGITASISSTIIIGLCTVIFIDGTSENIYLIMMLGVLGALIGFLKFNWKPAQIYMGDTGSQFLGVFLAGCGIIFFWKFKAVTDEFLQIKLFVIPVLYFIVPIIDTSTVTIRRLMRKQSPFVGGKDHITHHLIYLGLNEKQVSYLLAGISLLSIPLSFPILLNLVEWTWWVTVLYFNYFTILFIAFQYLYNKGAEKKKLKEKADNPLFQI